MAVPAEIPTSAMSAEEFFAFIDARPCEKWELIDGYPELIKRETPADPELPARPQAMGGDTLRHAMVSGNIAEAFSPGARGIWSDAASVLTGLGEALALPALGTELAVSEIYQGIRPGKG
jgi:hypothetical protein